ncbi:hypothetical protein Q5M45_15620 [Acinetobacter pittii]|uniref:hypothetical protein n=1 Tax=Acinetobacter pittii TaxID=48296 RepID=UPI0026EDC474|nr:hypothetical protein [Acinetobacter pittii]MDO7198832.1 hypothetical protein [Acinetobacter pittii]
MNQKVLQSSVQENEGQPEKIEKLTCGIIMPIAGMGPEYPAEHWSDVIKILHTAIERAGFVPRIVSDSEESTVIHGSIINNIYNDAIVVCDVSNKNANVMFELGMRLAFNKPVVIVKDDKTDYSFDTGNIQHEPYRRDLRHSTVEKFINDLAKKIRKTYEASLKNDYQSFLSYFGKFEVAKIENKSIGESEAIEKLLNKINSIDSKFNSLLHKEDSDQTYISTGRVAEPNKITVLTTDILTPEQIEKVHNEIISGFDNIVSVESPKVNEGYKVIAKFDEPLSFAERKNYAKRIRDFISFVDLPF